MFAIKRRNKPQCVGFRTQVRSRQQTPVDVMVHSASHTEPPDTQRPSRTS